MCGVAFSDLRSNPFLLIYLRYYDAVISLATGNAWKFNYASLANPILFQQFVFATNKAWSRVQSMKFDLKLNSSTIDEGEVAETNGSIRASEASVFSVISRRISKPRSHKRFWCLDQSPRPDWYWAKRGAPRQHQSLIIHPPTLSRDLSVVFRRNREAKTIYEFAVMLHLAALAFDIQNS